MSEEFKRMQKLAGINEIQVNKPAQLYYLSPLAKRVVNKDWEDLRIAYHEGIADAASVLLAILDLNNKDYQSKYITISNIEKYKKSIEPWAHEITMGMDEWDGTTESIINFLKDEGFLENKNVNEIQVNKPDLYKSIIDRYTIPQGWTKEEPSQYSGDENIIVADFSAPMEGWDTNNKDRVIIEKTPDGKFLVDAYISFGFMDIESPYCNTFKEAMEKAIKAMNDIKEDWDTEGAENEEF